ncbi:SAM-dependent methyltransferase [Putridiphycobacter roseus]|uniref:SAM-dependent methyltransferase n=2 Tax=Putridiphycobacter roseus TaxID=2219161 RepID=A0A2W1NFV6_9FLAO|nr:SAM-dependent methyltransferase [Putridiphycobacter roseus]
MDNKSHWEQVYAVKTPEEVSWTEAIPEKSLALIAACKLAKEASIIDIGGGDSLLVDHLITLGYTNITVLDISANAIARAQKRLGEKADSITWIVSDINTFKPTEKYDCWHDRAAFHFLTDPTAINHYVALVSQYVSQYLILGTFSKDGPKKCSGLDIQQYDEASMTTVFEDGFNAIGFEHHIHHTPFDTTQNFIFGTFKLKS